MQTEQIPQSVMFTLERPPSANVYWRVGRNGRMYISPEAKAYKEVAALKLNLMHVTPYRGHVVVTITAYMPYKAKGDLDNWAKVTVDAIKGHVFKDDNQVHELHMYRRYDKRNPRVEIEVRQAA